MFKTALPILGVAQSAAAEGFYCGKLGFRRACVHRPNPNAEDPCWMGVIRDGAHLMLSSFEGDGPPGSRGTQIMIEDAAAVQREYQQAGVDCGDALREESWGHTEFNVTDPDGNLLNFAQDTAS
jgi:catechol 2,3-dioxygenase-like lactoylglutathione lyase family enzyme